MGLISNIQPIIEGTPHVETKTKALQSKLLTDHFEKVRNLEKDLGNLPSPGEMIWLQSDGQFNAFTFIPFITMRETIQELYVATYSIAMRVVEALLVLHNNGAVDKIDLLISDSLKQRNPVTIDKILAYEQSYGNLDVKFAWTHAKVMLAKTSDNFYIVEGSGNFSENAHYEQYIFCNNEKAFNFRKELFTEINFR